MQQNKIYKYVYYLNIFGFLWVLSLSIFNFVPIPYWFRFIGLYVFFVTLAIETVVEKRWKITFSKEKIFYILLIVFFLWGYLYYPWDGSGEYFHYKTEQRLPLLGFGIAGLLGLNKYYSRSLIIYAMMFVSVVVCIFLCSKAGWGSIFFDENRALLFIEMRQKYVNSHMGFNFFLNATIIGMWYMLFHSGRKRSKVQWLFYSLVFIFLSAILLLSEGRSGFACFLIIVSMAIVYECYKRTKWLSVLFAIVCVSLVIFVFVRKLYWKADVFFQATEEEVFADLSESEIGLRSAIEDPRVAYWKSAFELIKEKPIVGYGISGAQERFNQVNTKYVSEAHKNWLLVLKPWYVDAHNQYIQTLMEFGLIGLFLLLAIYIVPVIVSKGKNSLKLVVFFTMMSMFQSMFDMFLTGPFNTIYCILMILCLTIKDDYLSKKESVE